MDMYETSDQVIIVAELPGVDKSDLEVEVEAEAAKIAGMRRAPTDVPGIRYHLAEIGYGRFERILRLPARIRPDQVEATYKNGLLSIAMPKQTMPHPRQIKVHNE
jgi:HSP20 family protein